MDALRPKSQNRNNRYDTGSCARTAVTGYCCPRIIHKFQYPGIRAKITITLYYLMTIPGMKQQSYKSRIILYGQSLDNYA
ncbi:MAG: hypothetical protein WCG19_02175 [Chlorobiaceae bacterium]